MPDLPQIRMMYRSGIKYKVMVATARIRHARNERNGTVQLNVLRTEHTNVISLMRSAATHSSCRACFLVTHMRKVYWRSLSTNLERKVCHAGDSKNIPEVPRGRSQDQLVRVVVTLPSWNQQSLREGSGSHN